jgi:hypothetical protein
MRKTTKRKKKTSPPLPRRVLAPEGYCQEEVHGQVDVEEDPWEQELLLQEAPTGAPSPDDPSRTSPGQTCGISGRSRRERGGKSAWHPGSLHM